ncbi:MAG: cytochrome c3 family protein [Planctomycetaceae bacterium]
MRKWLIGVVYLLLAVGFMFGIEAWRTSKDEQPDGAVSFQQRSVDYITSTACQECHAGEYQSWHASFHRTMTQHAGVDSVVAPIDDITVQSRGRSYRFTRQGDDFFVQMVDPDWEVQRLNQGLPIDGVDDLPVVNRKIVLTTGSHHYQAYWIRSQKGNELRQIPFVYHIATRQWIPREDAFLQLSSEEREFALWNENCINCHTTGGRLGYDPQQDAHDSSVVELGIACEACHGPGGRHAEFHRRNQESAEPGKVDPLIVNPVHLDSRRSAAVCGQCHADSFPSDPSDWLINGYADTFRPGELLDDSRLVTTYQAAIGQAADREVEQGLNAGESSFWKDGTHRVGGREYNGLIASGCYQRGEMTCLSCHSMHNYRDTDDQLSLKIDGNESCLQCHADFADRISEHTHHQAGSTGSMCYNCHMPHTTYALFKGIRSHRVDSPNSAMFVKTGRPNACNLCHMDQTLKWTIDYLQDWYGQPEVQVDSDNQTIAASILWLLKGDAGQRTIAVWSAGWKPAREASGGNWFVPYVAELLQDPYAAIRFMAARTLEKANAEIDSGYRFVGPEKERARVRVQVIEAWRNNPREKQPERQQRLLLDRGGLPVRSEIARLLRLRDNRRIVIAE